MLDSAVLMPILTGVFIFFIFLLGLAGLLKLSITKLRKAQRLS